MAYRANISLFFSFTGFIPTKNITYNTYTYTDWHFIYFRFFFKAATILTSLEMYFWTVDIFFLCICLYIIWMLFDQQALIFPLTEFILRIFLLFLRQEAAFIYTWQTPYGQIQWRKPLISPLQQDYLIFCTPLTRETLRHSNHISLQNQISSTSTRIWLAGNQACV